MKSTMLRVADSVVYRRAGDELVVIETARGAFYHFSLSTEGFLEFFETPAPLAAYVTGAGLDATEAEPLALLVEELVAYGILERVMSDDVETLARPLPAGTYRRPALLRMGERRLDEITHAFLYP